MAGTVVCNTLNTDTGLFSTNNAYSGIAKAWVNYNGNTQTVTNSFNVSSVTYSSSGTYTINFATAMPNANYCVTGMCDNSNHNGYMVVNGTPTTTSLPVQVFQSGSGNYNTTYVYIAILGN